MNRLGVNIDHIATLRNARNEDYPSLVNAAKVSLENGADQITVHLREDRRHIRDQDPFEIIEVTKEHGKLLNFEMGINDEIISIAKSLAPDWVCIVPEKREEQTTEGGLNLLDDRVFNRIEKTVKTFMDQGIKVSLFVESNPMTLEKCSLIMPDAVEIHTGDYAIDYIKGVNLDKHFNSYRNSKNYLDSVDISCHAGHGLTKSSLKPLIDLNVFEEYNIGHWIICESVFSGLGTVVKDLSLMIKG